MAGSNDSHALADIVRANERTLVLLERIATTLDDTNELLSEYLALDEENDVSPDEDNEPTNDAKGGENNKAARAMFNRFLAHAMRNMAGGPANGEATVPPTK